MTDLRVLLRDAETVEQRWGACRSEIIQRARSLGQEVRALPRRRADRDGQHRRGDEVTSTKTVILWCARTARGVLLPWTCSHRQRDTKTAVTDAYGRKYSWPALRRKFGLTIVRVEIREIG